MNETRANYHKLLITILINVYWVMMPSGTNTRLTPPMKQAAVPNKLPQNNKNLPIFSAKSIAI